MNPLDPLRAFAKPPNSPTLRHTPRGIVHIYRCANAPFVLIPINALKAHFPNIKSAGLNKFIEKVIFCTYITLFTPQIGIYMVAINHKGIQF